MNFRQTAPEIHVSLVSPRDGRDRRRLGHLRVLRPPGSGAGQDGKLPALVSYGSSQMKRVLLLLVPAALFAGQARYARLGEFAGKVEVQHHAGDPWSAAERNLPLAESAWLRTSASSRLEIELDDG